MIEIKEIEKLAELARLKIPLEEKEKVRSDINAILAYVGQISEAGTLISAGKGGGKTSGDKLKKSDHEDMVKNVLREDGAPHESGIFTEKLLAEVPEREGNYVKVKKIL